MNTLKINRMKSCLVLINILIAGLRLNNSSDVQYDGRSRVSWTYWSNCFRLWPLIQRICTLGFPNLDWFFQKQLQSITEMCVPWKSIWLIVCLVPYVQNRLAMANHFMLIIWAVYSNKMVSMASNGWLECPNLNQYYAIDYFCFTISCPGGSTIKYFNLPMITVLSICYSSNMYLCLKLYTAAQ